jgi:nitrite reductase/ring-hydroxylating ferredoxin subunit
VLVLLTSLLNINVGQAGPLAEINHHHHHQNAVFEDKCLALDQTLFKLREILRLTTASQVDEQEDDTLADRQNNELVNNYDDYVYAAADNDGHQQQHQQQQKQENRPRVVSSLKFSIARSTKGVCKIEISINHTVRFEFFDVHLLNRTLSYFVSNANEQNEARLDTGRVFHVFNFNYCHARKYYSVKMSETEVETVRVLAATMQRHAPILTANCRNNGGGVVVLPVKSKSVKTINNR